MNYQGITFVTPAGNAGNLEDASKRRTLDKQWPTNLGTDTNGVITVGGTDKSGGLLVETTPAVRGKPGSMTVYASAGALLALRGGGYGGAYGTSYSAPAVVSTSIELRSPIFHDISAMIYKD